MRTKLLAIAIMVAPLAAAAQVPQPAPQNYYQPTLVQPGVIPVPQGGLDNNRYYQNTYGQTVHSPANQYGGGVPAGALGSRRQ